MNVGEKLSDKGGLIPGAEPMNIVTRYEKLHTSVFDTEDQGADYVVSKILAGIKRSCVVGKPFVLGLTTGNTPVGVYRKLVECYERGDVDFSNVVIFTLDEFYPIAASEPQSRNYIIHQHLLNHINVKPENIFIPDGSVEGSDVVEFCHEYEQNIKACGGIDLMILGTGTRGQIGFNEPGSYNNSRTRLIALGNESRKAALKLFGQNRNVPMKAITMGVRTILDSRQILLVGWGEEKAEIMSRIVEGEISSQYPATYLQEHKNIEVVLDSGAAAQLTRCLTPWLVGSCNWTDRFIRKAVIWLCEKTGKPVLKLTQQDYLENSMGQILEEAGSYDMINIKVFNDLQHTITGWPGGKPNADDSTRPERSTPFPKRALVFSPHPDDDVISMGGTLLRLADQGHDVHVAYQTSGNIAVHDDVVVQIIDTARECGLGDRYHSVLEMINNKSNEEKDPVELRELKAAIRRGEARSACRSFNIPVDTNVHFLNLPFYETGGVKKGQLTSVDIDIIVDLLERIKPHQIYAAGDLSDPHGTHRVCFNAIIAALEVVKDREWVKDCRVWLYRGAWQEWSIDMVDMAVPLSPDEVLKKRHAIYRHLSQKDIVPFPGEDKREFWQRAEDRTQNTARLYDSLGMAEYQAIEVFVRLM